MTPSESLKDDRAILIEKGGHLRSQRMRLWVPCSIAASDCTGFPIQECRAGGATSITRSNTSTTLGRINTSTRASGLYDVVKTAMLESAIPYFFARLRRGPTWFLWRCDSRAAIYIRGPLKTPPPGAVFIS